jgi:hypothetical protein
MAGQGVSRQQDYVEEQDQAADSYPDSSVENESAKCVAPEKEEKDESYIQEVAMEILQNKWKPRLASVVMLLALADSTGRRIEEESSVVSLPVVVARNPESQRPNQNQ